MPQDFIDALGATFGKGVTAILIDRYERDVEVRAEIDRIIVEGHWRKW